MNESLSPAGVDAAVFRSTMRKFAAGVTVITTAHQDVQHGMTATAICSVCADPPTILAVVNRTARTHPLIAGAGVFTVNILAKDQQWLAERFGLKLANQFDGISYTPGKSTPSPVMSGVAAFLECQVVEQVEMGTHTIFVGRVIDCGTSASEPLAYFDGRYAQVADLSELPRSS